MSRKASKRFIVASLSSLLLGTYVRIRPGGKTRPCAWRAPGVGTIGPAGVEAPGQIGRFDGGRSLLPASKGREIWLHKLPVPPCSARNPQPSPVTPTGEERWPPTSG